MQLSRRFVSTCVIALAAQSVGCGSIAEPDHGAETDPGVCAQTYEFGNYGCGDANGLVLTRSGAAVNGAYVSLRLEGTVGGNQPLYALARSDTLGRYSLRATWLYLNAANAVRPDSAAAWVRAALVSAPGQTLIADSVRVMARFKDVGERAPSIAVPVLILPIP